MDKPIRSVRGHQIAALLWSIAGLLLCLGALVGGNVGLLVPIGMLNICAGMMNLRMSLRSQPSQREEPPPKNGA